MAICEEIPHNSLGAAGTEGSKPVKRRRLHDAPIEELCRIVRHLGKRNRNERVFAPLAKLDLFSYTLQQARGALFIHLDLYACLRASRTAAINFSLSKGLMKKATAPAPITVASAARSS